MRTLFLVLFCILAFVSAQAQPVGFSGMEKIDDSKFLVVFDKKNFQDGNRLAILSINQEKSYELDEIEVKDWKHVEGRGNDLESVCMVPGSENEYLLAESGCWEGDFGRIFYVELIDKTIKVKKVYQLPAISSSGKNNPEGDNFEGIACVKSKNDLYILLGERGGTVRFPNGLIRVGILKEEANEIDWQTYADKTFEAKLPKSVGTFSMMRTITDLHLDIDGRIFASAAIDASDIGPYKSFVYQLGTVVFKKGKLEIEKSKTNKMYYTVDGFKIEALSASPKFINNSKLCIGTEDENFPGQWRALFVQN